MIVRREGTSQTLITQPRHAALAADIMRRWATDGLDASPRRSAILLAVAEHDNGWAEVDRAPIVDAATGRMLDFINAPAAIRQGVWPRGVERLSATPYAAALVAAHALHIYRRYRTDPAWTSFFETMERARDRYLRASGAHSAGELEADYTFVRLGDLASLTFCNGWTDVQADGYGYTFQLTADRLVISPDPFAGITVPIEVAARRLPDRPFSSTADAERAFREAPSIVLHGVVSGPGHLDR